MTADTPRVGVSAVLLSGDLMVASRVEGAAARVGVPLRMAGGAEQVVAHVAAEPATVVVLDLSTTELNLPALVAALKSADRAPRIVAFGPHVHEQRLAAARQAGCDLVISRGQFFGQLDAILAGEF